MNDVLPLALQPGVTGAYKACPELCGRMDEPGVAVDSPVTIDFANRHTTIDQLAIEEALETMELAGRRILHVGVGNCSLGVRFGRRAIVDGLTIAENERALAASIPGAYRAVHLLNKYSRDFLRVVGETYDAIVDNNLAGFACCRFHFYSMLDHYCASLLPGGRILTHQRGMNWAFADERWKLTWMDLVGLGAKFPLDAEELGNEVYALRRRAR
jgi:hypothetical protein